MSRLVVMRRLVASLVLVVGFLGSGTPIAADIRSELFASGFLEPVFAIAPPGDERLFVVERAGIIRIVDSGGSVLTTPFLDISFEVSTAGDRGLFGLEFDPQYASNGLFYVYYVDLTGELRISRFSVSANPDVATLGSEEVVFALQQPYVDHNGGTIAFRPTDGFLYLTPGDGGGVYDPDETSQDPQNLLGKMLRLDVSGGPGTVATVPPNNPFVTDGTVLDEIWSFGLRHPFRFSFDRANGDLWIADVGQADLEEINYEAATAPGGRNYGWDVMEGTLCNPTDPSLLVACNDPSLTLPVFEYDHALGDCSITGGYVYRGSIPEIQGLYFYGDFCTGRVSTLDPQTYLATDRSVALDPPGLPTIDFIAGFGQDGFGELYIVDLGGEVFRVRSTEADTDDDVVPDAVDNCSMVVNPDQLDTDGDSMGDACDPDDDNDGISDGADCAPLDDQAWAIPGAVESLLLAHTSGVGGSTTLSWMAPVPPGGSQPAYDTLRTDNASDFTDPAATCIEVDDSTDSTANDSGAPLPGGVRFFVVRAANACGEASQTRVLRVCP